MKKLLIVALVVAVCFGALVTAGCGETSKAQEYMEKGDELSAKMRTLTNEDVFDTSALLAELGVQVSETGKVNWKTVTDAANKELDSIIANGEKAITEYEKILDLGDVDKYKEYARQRISAIESTIAVLEAIQVLLDELGDPNNTKSPKETLTQWAESNLGVAVDAVKAFTSWRNADKVKKENDLGPTEKVVEESASSGSAK